MEDLPLLVPVGRAASPSGIKARIKSSPSWMTWQQGILPPKAKPAPRQLRTNHHEEHFRVGELRAQPRPCSHVEAGDRREGMQCLQSSSPAADLLRNGMLQVKSGPRQSLQQAVNQPAAPRWEANPHPCGNGRRLINLIPCPSLEKLVRDGEEQKFVQVYQFLLPSLAEERRSRLHMPTPALITAFSRRGRFSSEPVPLRQQQGKSSVLRLLAPTQFTIYKLILLCWRAQGLLKLSCPLLWFSIVHSDREKAKT